MTLQCKTNPHAPSHGNYMTGCFTRAKDGTYISTDKPNPDWKGAGYGNNVKGELTNSILHPQPPRFFVSDEESINPGYPNRPIVYIHPWVTNAGGSSRIIMDYVSGIFDRVDLVFNADNNTYYALYHLTDAETHEVTTYELNVCEDAMDLITCMVACEDWINNGYDHESLGDGTTEEDQQNWWQATAHADLMRTQLN